MTPTLLAALLVAAGIAALLLSLALNAAAIPLARRIGFVDRPGAHKTHREARPYGGGTAIFLAAWVPAAAVVVTALLAPLDRVGELFGETIRVYVGGLRLQATPTLVLLLGGVVLHGLGVLDDVRPLGPWPKLAVVAGVGAFVSAVAGVRIAEFLGPAAAIGLTTLWIVVIVNAFNFLDNMDGLAAGVAAICLAALIACGLLAGQVLVPALGCLFLGAIAGFWMFNFPPARIFMGDGGSLLIGYMLAVMSVMTTYYESGRGGPAYALAMPLVILAVPLYDFASVVLIRVREGRNPMRGDQRHFSHRLLDHGLSRRGALLTIYAATGATALAATLLPGAALRETLSVVALVMLVLLIIAILESPRRNGA